MSAGPAILLIDDDVLIQMLVEDVVTQMGGTFTAVGDGAAAQATLNAVEYDLVILDRRLPDMDGLLLVPLLKDQKKVPFIVLSSMDETNDQLLGLGMGAKDYICKPVEPALLRARISAQLTTRHAAASDVKAYKSLRLNILSRRLTINGVTVVLSPAETKLLSYFMDNFNKPCDRMQISKKVLGRDWGYGDRTVDVVASRLRRHIKNSELQIVTIHGLGYALSDRA